jgi:hypothetical protein
MKTQMKKRLLRVSLTACLLFAMMFAFGQAAGVQKDVKQQKKEMIQAQKVAFITRELQFGTEEAQKFWPLYNEFNAKKDEIAKSKKELAKDARKTGIDQLSDKQAEDLINTELQCEQQILDLKKEYKDKFKAVIGPKKVIKLYQSEKKFNSFLLKQLKEGGKPPADE